MHLLWIPLSLPNCLLLGCLLSVLDAFRVRRAGRDTWGRQAKSPEVIVVTLYHILSTFYEPGTR